MKDFFRALALLFVVCVYMIGADYLEKMPPAVYPTAGFATWYTSRITSTGEGFSDDLLTCAMRRREYGKLFKVCDVDNGACVIVRHNDWGPRRALFENGRIIDLSRAAFLKLAPLEKGIIRVTIDTIDAQ